MPKISIIIPCKKRLSHLKQTIKAIAEQTYQNLEIIVVDYACPEKTAKWVNAQRYARVKSFVAKVGDKEWNLSHSRNLGALQAGGSVLLFLDADTIVKENFVIDAFTRLHKGNFLTGLTSPPWNGCGCMMIFKDDFFAAKGYNEAIEGWAPEDIDMYDRLQSMGLVRNEFDRNLIINMQHGDDIRNEFHGGVGIFETQHHALNNVINKEFKSCI